MQRGTLQCIQDVEELSLAFASLNAYSSTVVLYQKHRARKYLLLANVHEMKCMVTNAFN